MYGLTACSGMILPRMFAGWKEMCKFFVKRPLNC